MGSLNSFKLRLIKMCGALAAPNTATYALYDHSLWFCDLQHSGKEWL